jgi:penicillin-binding protein 2
MLKHIFRAILGFCLRAIKGIKSLFSFVSIQFQNKYFDIKKIEKNYSHRSIAMGIIIFAFIFTATLKLYDLQIYSYTTYRQTAESISTYTIVTPVVRGSIYDRNKQPLSTNRSNIVLTANREILLHDKEDLRAVARVLNTTEQEIINKLTICKSSKPDGCWNGSPYQEIPLYEHLPLSKVEELINSLTNIYSVNIFTYYDRIQSDASKNLAQIIGYLSSTISENDNNYKELEKLQRAAPKFFFFGKAGLEAYYDTLLRGVSGQNSILADSKGKVLKKTKITEPVNGSSLVTTIDAKLQDKVTEELDNAIYRARGRTDSDNNGKRFIADTGAALVLNHHNGDILAMVTYPQHGNLWDSRTNTMNTALYDSLLRDKNKPLLNRAYMSAFPPGSTFKAVTTSAMGNAGYNLNSSYLCSSDFRAGGSVYNNYHKKDLGLISLQEAIDVSCNTVFYRAGYEMWKQDEQNNTKEYLVSTSKSYNFDKKLGIDLPGESSGEILDRENKIKTWEKNKDKWCELADRYSSNNDKNMSRRTRATLRSTYRNKCLNGYKFTSADAISEAVGQSGITVTPLQLASAYGAIANGGTVWQPRVVGGFINESGVFHARDPVVNSKVAVNSGTLNFLRSALYTVSQSGTSSGYLSSSKLNGMQVASKTGTAEVEGKSSQGWLATFNKDYVVLMTITQAGGGAASSGEAVANIYKYLGANNY